MRSKVELLQLLLDAYTVEGETKTDKEQLYRISKLSGMCLVIKHMYSVKVIDIYERNAMFEMLKDYKSTDDYWWSRGIVEPRIEWIKLQIKIEELNDKKRRETSWLRKAAIRAAKVLHFISSARR